MFTFVDVLVRGQGTWKLYEGKSSTGLKDHYFWDVALQIYLLGAAGLNVSGAHLVHLNGECRRKGSMDPDGLYVKVPAWEFCEEQ